MSSSKLIFSNNLLPFLTFLAHCLAQTNNHLFRIVSFQTMSSSTQDLQWLFFDVFGTVVDWKSHMSATLFTISQRVDPESMKAHSRSTDEHWQDFAQEWRTGFMKGVKELMGKREDAGMDVRMHPLTWSPHVASYPQIAE